MHGKMIYLLHLDILFMHAQVDAAAQRSNSHAQHRVVSVCCVSVLSRRSDEDSNSGQQQDIFKMLHTAAAIGTLLTLGRCSPGHSSGTRCCCSFFLLESFHHNSIHIFLKMVYLLLLTRIICCHFVDQTSLCLRSSQDGLACAFPSRWCHTLLQLYLHLILYLKI